MCNCENLPVWLVRGQISGREFTKSYSQSICKILHEHSFRIDEEFKVLYQIPNHFVDEIK